MLNWNDIIRYANHGSPSPARKLERSLEQWKTILTEEEFRVTCQKGTEQANNSEMCSFFEPGKYLCKCCNTWLFDATEKFESGSGWPSVTQPANLSHIAYHKDKSCGMYRVEVTCNICDAHLGHVFPDGPKPSGLRFCINSISLQKIEPSNESNYKGQCGIDREANPCGDASDY